MNSRNARWSEFAMVVAADPGSLGARNRPATPKRRTQSANEKGDGKKGGCRAKAPRRTNGKEQGITDEKKQKGLRHGCGKERKAGRPKKGPNTEKAKRFHSVEARVAASTPTWTASGVEPDRRSEDEMISLKAEAATKSRPGDPGRRDKLAKAPRRGAGRRRHRRPSKDGGDRTRSRERRRK